MSNNTQTISPPSIEDIANADISIASIGQIQSHRDAVSEEKSIAYKDLDKEARTSEH